MTESRRLTVEDRLERHAVFTPDELAPLVRPGHQITITANGRTVTAGRPISGRITRVRAGTARAGVFEPNGDDGIDGDDD